MTKVLGASLDFPLADDRWRIEFTKSMNVWESDKIPANKMKDTKRTAKPVCSANLEESLLKTVFPKRMH
jgi:hypothetical protein